MKAVDMHGAGRGGGAIVASWERREPRCFPREIRRKASRLAPRPRRLAPMPAPATEYVSPGGKPFAVRCEDRADYLYAVVTGPKGDTDVGVALWRVLAGEVEARRSRCLLVESRL